MITRDPSAFLDELESGLLVADGPATPRGVFMVEPMDFRISAESAQDNAYMDPQSVADPDRALQQYIRLMSLIRESGVPVKSFPGRAETPDDVFPNNVFATALPRRFIVGRMRHKERQRESERQDIRNYFQSMGYELVDLSKEEGIAELTGTLVIDRPRRIGFCGMSTRVDDAGLRAMHEAFRLRCTLQFDLAEGEYHTNVVLSVLAGRACVMHPGSIPDARIRRSISLTYPGRVLYLDDAEKAAFAANCIALTPNDLFMSQRAADALLPANRAFLEAWGFRIRACELDEIEKAGGSLRCMVAEIF